MLVHTTMGKWGNSLAIRVPSALAESLALREGSGVELVVENETLIVRPRKVKEPVDMRRIVAEMDPSTFPDESFDTWPIGEELL